MAPKYNIGDIITFQPTYQKAPKYCRVLFIDKGEDFWQKDTSYRYWGYWTDNPEEVDKQPFSQSRTYISEIEPSLRLHVVCDWSDILCSK